MFGVIVVVGIYVASLILVFFEPEHFFRVVVGFILIGFVYGSYGLLVGSVLKGELEGILMITLLANIDVGWLQNPVYFADALNKSIIQGLPAFFPSQVSIISAFSDHEILKPIIGSIIYGTAFLFISLLIYWLKMRKSR
jgi:hypothetical protein